MCSECRQYPCHPMCPNADEPPIVCECEICGQGICAGDTKYVIDGSNICEDCVDNGRTYAELDD